MALETEQRLGGRYRLVEPIGYGGMGRVFQAHDELLDRAVAVKLLEASTLEAGHLAEARAAARLSHPGVVHVFDVGIQDGTGYIVMELLSGDSLHAILRTRGSLPVAEASELAAQIADALEAIHRLGMVHCDVKPLNVIVTPDGQPRLVDFGIARASAMVGANMGSAAYLAPEQARGEPVDARTDVYALGAVLYEMLAGDRPFGGANATDLVRRKLVTDPRPLRSACPRVPAEFEAIVMRALQRDPARRYQSAAALRDALRAAVARTAEPTRLITPIRVPALPQLSRLAHLPRLRRMTPVPQPVLAFAVAVTAIVLLLGGWRLTHPPNNGVPMLVGHSLSEVPALLEQAGIPPADATVLTRPVEAKYVGTVVDQQPQPGLPRDADGGLQIAVGVAR